MVLQGLQKLDHLVRLALEGLHFGHLHYLAPEQVGYSPETDEYQREVAARLDHHAHAPVHVHDGLLYQRCREPQCGFHEAGLVLLFGLLLLGAEQPDGGTTQCLNTR